ncbi:MAG: hypothetical protein AAF203_01110, partial [Pseudomonadota bacterium]
MKSIIIILASFITLFATQGQAKAMVIGDESAYKAAILDQFEIDHDYMGYINRGSVAVDLINETVTLYLSQYVECPEGMACATVLPEYHEIKLPLISVSEEGCGATVYKAQVNNMPVDGLLETLTVTDYTTLQCRILMPYMTKVVYSSTNPW